MTKKMRIAILSAWCLTFFAMGCNNKQETMPINMAELEAAIRNADVEWSKASASQDKDKFKSYFLEDSKMLAPNSSITEGKEAVETMIDAIFEMPGFSLNWQPNTVAVANSGDLGYSIGTYEMRVDGPDGNPQVDQGKYLTIWKKQADGNWKVAVDMFNSDM